MRDKLLSEIDGARKALLQAHDQVARLWAKHGSPEFHESVLTAVVLSRSKALTRAFFDLLVTQNLTTAAPLLRLQLDSLLRLVAMYLVADQHEFFEAILDGENVSRCKDAGGNRMTDKYLCDRVAEFAPWVRSLYKQASGFIHLSYKHIAATVQGYPDQGTIGVWMADEESYLEDDSYDSIAGAFGLATRMLLDFICEVNDPNEAHVSYAERRDKALSRMAKSVGDMIREHGIPATAAEIDYLAPSERTPGA